MTRHGETRPSAQSALPDESKLTRPEQDALRLSAQLANALGALKRVHRDEVDEAVLHVHALQTSILARAAYHLDDRQ